MAELGAQRSAARVARRVLDATRMGWRRSTWRARRAPDFLIIGAQRCGTSSLYRYLTQHPGIDSALRKEVHFFDDNFARGLSWYRAHFAVSRRTGAALTGEGSPYYIYHPAVPQRVSQTLARVKLIALLRNPVVRAYSHFHHECRMKRETLSFEEAIDLEAERLNDEGQKLLDGRVDYSFNHRTYSYLDRGIYVDQLKNWERFFPKEQMLILKCEDFYEDTAATLRQTYEFLELPPAESRTYRKPKYPGYPPMSPATTRRLTEHFEPHNQRLYEHLGRRFDW